MKHFKTFLFAALLFIGATGFSVAQTKVAHINTTELVKAMPEMKSAQAEIEKLSKTYDTQIKDMTTELQNKMKQYQSEAETKTDDENASRVKELQEFEQSIMQYRSQAQQDLAQKEAKLVQPILEKAKNAIQKVAKAQGFQYVLDSTQGSGVLVADGKDLLEDVKKELGI